MSSSVWTSLTAGATKKSESDIFWNGLILIVAVGAVVGLLVMMRARNTTKALVLPSKVSWDNIESDPAVMADGAARSDDTVRAKSSIMSIWAHQAVTDSDELPIADDPNGYSYSKFQQALLSGVERQVDTTSTMKVHSAKDLENWNVQLQPLRDMLNRANKTIEQWMDENNATLPEDVVEMWHAVKTMPAVFKPAEVSFSTVSAEEASSIVRDAMQNIPGTNTDYAATVMREILHARAEGSSLGMQVPELSMDQKRALEFWKASAQMPAADLAAKILSRV